MIEQVVHNRSHSFSQSHLLHPSLALLACDSDGARFNQGSISAVNLMEFDQRLNSADKGHRDCIDAMKEFWKRVAKNKRHGTKAYNAPEKVRELPTLPFNMVAWCCDVAYAFP